MKKKPLSAVFLLLIFLILCGCGGGSGGANDANIHPTLSASSLALTPTPIETKDVSTLTAEVKDQNGNSMPGVSVSFRVISGPGVLTVLNATTSNYGIAETTLRSSSPGFVSVMATAPNLTKAATVYFPPAMAPSAELSLAIDHDGDGKWNEPPDFNLVDDGKDTATVMASLMDAAGLPVANRQISFSSADTNITFPFGSTAVTDKEGEAFVKISTSKTPDPATNFTVAAYDPLTNARDMITVFLVPVPTVTVQVAAVVVTAVPSTIQQKGSSKITVKALLTDGGTPPDGTLVTVTSSAGTIDPFAQLKSGEATATYLNNSQTGNATITATVGGVSGTTTITVGSTLSVSPVRASVIGIANPDTNPADDVTFTVTGGVPPYTVASNNAALAAPFPTTVTNEGRTFVVDPGAVTTNTVVSFTVTDSKGATVQTSLTVGAALIVSPPSLLVTGGAHGNVVFTISGGTPPYAIISEDPTLVVAVPSSVSTNGGIFLLDTGSVTAAANVNLNITDSQGAKTKCIITVIP